MKMIGSYTNKYYNSKSCAYNYDMTKNELYYSSSFGSNETSKLILEIINLPQNYIQLIENVSAAELELSYKNTKIVISSIGKEINKTDNNGSFFVIPSQLNGAEYKSYGEDSIVKIIDAYINDNTGGPIAQLAVHHAIGQFLIDNAENSYNQNGINAVKNILQFTNNIKLFNGYLSVPKNNEDYKIVLQNLSSLIIIGITNALVLNNEKTHVHMIYASAIPVKSYTNRYLSDNLLKIANYVMIGEYYGGLEKAYLYNKQINKKGNIYLMPLGGGVFNNSIDNIKINIAVSIHLLSHKYIDWINHLEIYVLAWEGNKIECKILGNLNF